MAQEWQQTGTASNTIGLGFAGVKCDTTTLATNPLEKTCELSGSGGSEVTVTLPAKANYTAAIFAADEAVGVTSIPSGTWNVKVNVTSAASSGSQIAEVHICRVNSSGVSQATIASATGLAVDAATTGVKSIDVTQGSAHSCSATDHFYVQVVVYSNSHGGTTIGITPNQLITDTITPVQTWNLAGTIAGQGTVTGDVKPVRRLAGTIAAASSFVGDLKPIRKLAGAIAATSTFVGNLGPPFAKHVLAGTIAASALFGGDLIPTRQLAGSIAGQSTVAGDLKGQRKLAGTIGGQSTLTGDLVIASATHVLDGDIAAQSSFTGDLKVTRKLDSSKRLVDYYYDPPSTTVADSEADFHLQVTWTTVDQTTLSIFPRYVSFNDKVEIAFRSDGVNALALSYRLDNVSYPVKSIDQVFVDDTEYTADIYGHGDTIKIDIDSVEKINESVPFHTDEEGCRIDHQAEIADIEFFSYSHPDGIGGKGEFTGDLKVTRKLAGTIAGASTFLGDLGEPYSGGTTWDLAGHIVGQSTFAGTFAPQTLAGAVAGASTFIGDLGEPFTSQQLGGAIAGQSAFTGDAIVTRALVGHVAGQSTIVGDLKRDVKLAGGIAAQSTLAGDLVIPGVFPSGWAHKVAITIDSADIDADLTDWTLNVEDGFSSILTQVNGPLDADGTAPALDGGGDIRFTSDAAGQNQLACDIRHFETDNTPANGVCDIAVGVSHVSSTYDTTVWMWWGKTGATQPAASHSYGQYNAYDSDHIGVWSFGDWEDRLGNYDADTVTTGDAANAQTGGPLGYYADFDGDDIQSTSSMAHGIGTDPFAFEIVAKAGSTPGIWDAFCAFGTYNPAMYLRTGGTPWGFHWPSSGTNALTNWYLDTTNWHHAVFNRNGNNGYCRRDGASDSNPTTNCGATVPNNPLHFGSGLGDTTEAADCHIAEFRLHSDDRSVAWWNANYANQLDGANFITVGAIDAEAVNLWPNANLEDGVGDWESSGTADPAIGTTYVWQGTRSLKFVPTAYIWDGHRTKGAYHVPVEPSTQYTISFYIRVQNATVGYTTRIRDQDLNVITSNAQTYTADAWVRRSLTFTTGSDDSAIELTVSKNNNASTDQWNIDGIQLETGSTASPWVEYSPPLNLFENASQETYYQWTAAAGSGGGSQSSEEARVGTYSLKVSVSDAGEGVRLDDDPNYYIPVKSSTEYTLSFYVNPSSATMTIDCSIYDQNTNWLASGGYTYGTGAWTRREHTFTTGSDDTHIQVYFRQMTTTETGYFHIDCIQLEENDYAREWVDYIDAGATTHDLAGTIAGAATFTGAITQEHTIAGTIAAQATFAGDLKVTRELAGSVAAQSTLTGDLKVARELAGAVAAQSTFTGDLKVTRGLAGSVAGQATFAGDLKRDVALVGAVAGQSTFAGNLKGQRPLAGTIAGQSTFTGNLEITTGTKVLDGHIAAQSTFSGDLKVIRDLAGSITGQSTFAGNLRGQRPLAGSIDAQSTLTGDLVPQRQLAGSIDGQSTFSGELKVDRQLAGSVDGQSTFTGTLAQTHRLVGTIAGQSTFTGNLILDDAPLPLAGTIAGQSTLSGTLAQEMRLVGGVAAQSTFAGDLKVIRGLAGTVAGQSTFTGDLKRDVKLAGAITAQSTLTGDLAPLRKLAGVIAGQSTFLGDLTLLQGTWVLDGHIAGQSTFAGDLKQTHTLAGAIAGQSTVAGDLKGRRKLEGSIDAQSTFLGDLQIAQAVWSLQGAIAGQSTFSGEMTGTLRLVGVIAAASEFTGHLTQHMVLAGAIQGQSTFVGNLRWMPLGAWPLVGHINGQSTFSGTLLSIYRGRISGSVGSNRVGGTVGSNRVGGSLNDGDSGTVV